VNAIATVAEQKAPKGFEHVDCDLSDCNVVIVSCGLHSFEKPQGLRPEQWPDAVRIAIERQLDTWLAGYGKLRRVKLISHGVCWSDGKREGYCFTVLHHAPKNGAACQTCT
jgi:hypothetical protein